MFTTTTTTTSTSATRTESLPTTWDEQRDGTFFRIVADLFPPAFCAGAGVLLASYDDEAPESSDATSPQTSRG